MWNPDLDADKLLNYFCAKAYGSAAGALIRKLYDFLGDILQQVYKKHANIGLVFTPVHMKEFYADHYEEIERYVLKALELPKEPKQQKRLELFGQVLSLLQWNLRYHGFLSPHYQSPLTLDTDQVDALLTAQQGDIRVTHSDFNLMPFGGWPKWMEHHIKFPAKVEPMPALADAKGAQTLPVPLARESNVLLYFRKSCEARLIITSFEGAITFVRYSISDSQGKQLRVGVMAKDRVIPFKGKEGESYLFTVWGVGVTFTFQLEGDVSTAYRTFPPHLYLNGMGITGSFPLYFYVPKEISEFTQTLGNPGAVVDIFTPDGVPAGQLNGLSRITIKNKCGSGFWKVVFHAFHGRIGYMLDEKLSQWLIADPAHPIKITPPQP